MTFVRLSPAEHIMGGPKVLTFGGCGCAFATIEINGCVAIVVIVRNIMSIVSAFLKSTSHKI